MTATPSTHGASHGPEGNDPIPVSEVRGVAGLVSLGGQIVDAALFFPDGTTSSPVTCWHYRSSAGLLALPVLTTDDESFTQITYAEMRVTSADGADSIVIEADAPVTKSGDSFAPVWPTYSTYGARGSGLTVNLDGDLAARGIDVDAGGMWYIEFYCQRNA